MPDHPNPRYCVFELRGPYGTNLGDIWEVSSDINDRLREEKNLIGIWEVLNGADDPPGTPPEPRMYSVALDNPDPDMQDLIRRAREGTKLYLAEQAKRN